MLAARIAYLIWLSPWELVGDEAYYWEWSRHLDWCYYEKGPGNAFLLAPFIKLFGVHEWAVRLPVALVSAAAAWVLGRLAVSISGNERAGLLTVILFCLTPAFIANAQLYTQDGMMILTWSVLSAYGLRLIRRWETGETRLRDWLAPAIWLGVGFLFKQSILLFVPSLLVYAWVRRRKLEWKPRVVAQAAVAGAVAALFAIPMLVWNARHGWPTLAHTLGHLGAGGDHAAGTDGHYSPGWFFSLVGAQVGAVGPGALALMGIAAWAALRQRDDDRYAARLWMLCCALPSIAFFVLLSATKPVLGSWPFPSYVTLAVLAGDLMSPAGLIGRRAKGPYRAWWNVAIAYGIGGALLLSFPTWLEHIPVLSKKTTASILAKMTGHRVHARAIDAARRSPAARTSGEPIVIARYYMVAALDAFYLPDHPTVYCAGTFFGKRPTAYDFWPGTDLSDPALHGRGAVMDGNGPRPWGGGFAFERVDPPSGGTVSIGTGYGGPIPRDKRPVVESAHD